MSLSPQLAFAQAVRLPEDVPESVTVAGTKSQEVFRGFVRSFATANRLTGKMARWESGICPTTVGLKPEFANFISQHVKDIARQVGAPVSDRENCTPNIAVVFTTAPQELLDSIRDLQPGLLGYFDNTDQRNRLATVTHPIQGWYMSATQDVRGKTQIDTPKTAGIGLEIPCEFCPGGHAYLPNATAYDTTGTRLGDGLRSEFYNVIIVADRNKLATYEIGPLADYVALLALTQVTSLDTYQQLPSIVNMLAGRCDEKSEVLTVNDKAYLRALYKAASDQTLGIQQNQVAYQMEQELKGH